MGVEGRLWAHIAKKYPGSLQKFFHDPYSIPSDLMEFRQKNEKKLIQVLSNIPNWGIGRIVTTMDWPRETPTYWRITRVHVDYETDNFDYGLVWGVFTDNGRSQFYEEQIIDAQEHIWRLIPKYEESYFINYQPESKSLKQVPLYIPFPPLLSQIFLSQKAEENNNNSEFNKKPLVRLLIDRSPKNAERQMLDDGTLV